MDLQLPPRRLNAIMIKGKLRHLDKGEMLDTSEGNGLFCLVKNGFVKRYLITNDGSYGVQSIYGPGYAFPLTLVHKVLLDQSLYDGQETYYYEAMCPTELYSITGDELKAAVEANPTLYRDLLHVAGRRLHANIQRLENIALPNYYKRVAHQLAFYARKYGEAKAGGIKITIPLTHQDIANVLSATRETVSISIAELRKKGLIKTGSFILVRDLKKLEEEAYG